MKLRILFTLCWLFAVNSHAVAQNPSQKTYGLDFSPYLTGQSPNANSQIGASQILSRMQVISPYTTWIRSFGSTNGLENIPSIGRQLGLKVAANAWIGTNLSQNSQEIANLIGAAMAGLVDVAIVGSEAIHRGDVSESQLIAYMNQVRQAVPGNVQIATADTYDTFLAHPNVVAASDVVFANFYPYWEGTSINNAVCSLTKSYAQLAAASGPKQVVISETGWPSAGNPVGAAVPSAANSVLFAQQFFTWARTNNVPSFYFEAFDEASKGTTQLPQEAYWGIWDANGAIKPGMNAFFQSQFSMPNCDGTIPGRLGSRIPMCLPTAVAMALNCRYLAYNLQLMP